ncbi:penicillin-binding protein 2 [Sphingomonas lacunae]|uniref:Penicillin-binding protein 2 n=2 Tax=Sphingomonas lacunae TaxID=2698828 RepID=A0A6M4AXB5_9SPHN|nr:penicillin-binding protein 2 [Sphingomonas lacunae]
MRRADCRQRFALAADQRLRILLLAFLFIGAVLLARIGHIFIMGLINGGGAAPAAMFDRADIVDRNGVPLARSIPVHSIRSVRSKLMHDPRMLARELARIFPDTTEATFYSRLTGRPSSIIRRRATPDQLNAVNELAEIGFEYPEEPERLYPQGPIAAHVLGFVAPGRGGVMGIERRFDEQLAANAARGEPFALSLDTRVQAALELELGDAVTQLEAKGGAGLVLDVDTGEVLAMASMPTFDPNRVNFSDPAAQWNSVSFTTFELGSTFKPITVAAAMDAGVITDMARRYDATRPLTVGGHRISDSHSADRWLNVPEALVHSSNVVTAQIADDLGKDRLQATFRALDFDKRPTIELPERGLPQWPRSWGRTTTMTAGFGHSIMVTPLHLASAYAALVNGGIWRPATILKVEEGHVVQGRRVFTESTSARMRQLLRMIVASGTGSRADAPGYRVGGKTGSAERVIDGTYVGNSVVATFAGAFPMDRPRYVVLVMIDRPPGNAYSLGQRTAGFTAAPVVRKVVQRIGPMVGIYPDAHRDVDISELEPLLWKPRAER